MLGVFLPDATAKCRFVPVASTKSGNNNGPPDPKSASAFDKATVFDGVKEPMTPIDFLSCLVSDGLTRRVDRLLERHRTQAQFRDPQVTFDNFDFDFNKKINRSLVFDLATATFVARHEDALFLGPPGTGKSHLAQAIGKAVIGQGYRVIYREAHILLAEIADAVLDGKRKEHMELLATVPLLIIDDLGMRKLGPTAAEELL
jgi:DNA replication protein DnaC